MCRGGTHDSERPSNSPKFTQSKKNQLGHCSLDLLLPSSSLGAQTSILLRAPQSRLRPLPKLCSFFSLATLTAAAGNSLCSYLRSALSLPLQCWFQKSRGLCLLIFT